MLRMAIQGASYGAKKMAKKFAKDEDGAAMVEYTILLGIITVAVIGAIIFVGGWVGDQWDALETDLTGEGAPPT